jgi:thiamine biosynthesis lipoprotein
MTRHDFTFRAMNTDIDLLIHDDRDTPPLDALLSARLLFDQQEERFSRFRPGSLVSRLNRGESVDDGLLALACRMALEAWEFTLGRFNPLILPALVAAGYDRTFEDVRGGEPRLQDVPAPPEHIRISGSQVSLRDAQIDLGGLVKGWTVDRAVERLRSEHPNLLLNAGGDIRCAGGEGGGAGWLVSVASSFGGRDLWRRELQGAMATSSAVRRSWPAAGGTAHHIIDPASGLPARSGIAQATVWAGECWRAECWAKAIVIGGAEALEECRAAGLQALAEDSPSAGR